MRDWKKFDNDEIITIWKGYLETDFPFYDNPLRQRVSYFKPMRLTPMEIVKLVDELIDRLNDKENPKDGNDNTFLGKCTPNISKNRVKNGQKDQEDTEKN